MRIQWLNDERTRAIVIKGRWWWKRQAEVRRLTETERLDAYHYDRWVFASGDREPELSAWVEDRRDKQRRLEEKRAEEERNWRRADKLPEARVRRLP